MITCKNCGHKSHCGIKLMVDFRFKPNEAWQTNGMEGQVEVCKNCRCTLCIPTDEETILVLEK